MKISLLLTLSLTLLFACKRSKKQAAQNTTADTTIAAARNPLPDYKAYIKNLDSTDINKVSAAAKKYNELFAGADTSAADSAYVLFSLYYDKMTGYLNEQHIKDPTNYTAYVMEEVNVGSAKKTARADVWVQRLKENGFKVAMTEGSTYIKQDRTLLKKYFYQHVSANMKEYLIQLNKENEEGFIEDAGLVITPLQLAKRVLWWEKFIKDHPAFPFIKEIKEKQKGYITFLLEGIDNSPLRDYETKQLDPNYKEAYEYIVTTQSQSNTAALLIPYYQALKQKDEKKIQMLLRQYKKQGIIYDYSA